MRVLLVYDIEKWAWHNKALAIQKYMPKSYFDNVKIMNIGRFKNNSKEEISRANSLHVFGFKQGARWAKIASTSIASYYSMSKSRRKYMNLLNTYRCVAAVNKDLTDRLKTNIGGKAWCLPNGVDDDIYFPIKRKNKKLVVGWVGKPMWTIGWKRVGSYLEYMGMGGLWPDLKEKIQNLPNIEVREISNLPNNAVDTKTIVDFYQNLDVFLCFHYKCGTPNPAFEAAACGCCVITTPCGAFKEVAHDGGAISISGYYGETDKEKIKNVENDIIEKIKSIDNDELRRYFETSVMVIKDKWTWKKRVTQWNEMLYKARYK